MPAGEIIRGIDGIMKILDTSDVEIGEIPCLLNWEISASATTRTINTKCMLSNSDGGSAASGGWDATETDSKGYTMSSNHRWQEDQTIPTQAAVDVDDVGTKIKFEVYPNTAATGKVIYSGTAIITSVSVPSEVNGEISQTVNFTGDGALVKALVA